MRFSSLGSGSRGNATLIEAGETTVMVDCGFSIRDTEKRLARLQKDPSCIHAILVTHEHSDHVRGVDGFARKYKIPVWMTAGTHSACMTNFQHKVDLFNAHESFVIRDIYVQPFPVPHDAREPSQFVFADGNTSLGLLTDTGCSTPHIEESLSGLDALILESNHDLDMLMNGRYPPSLKNRVAGRYGHLSNEQAAELLSVLDTSKLQHIVAAHLSEKNNLESKVLESFSCSLDCTSDWVTVAGQDTGFGWREIR